MLLKLGDIFDEVQADLPALTQIKDVKRAANRSITQINNHFSGYKRDDIAVIRQVADVTESIVFAAGGVLTVITDSSSAVSPGFLCAIEGSDFNDDIYPVTSIGATTVTGS